MEIDVIPFLDYAISLLAVVITAVVGVVGKRLNDRFKLEIEFRHREVLQEALSHSVAFAVNRARALYKKTPPIQIRSRVVGTALEYVIKSVPDALRQFGIKPNTQEGQKRIMELVETRLDTRFFDFEKEEGEVVQLIPKTDKLPPTEEKKDD